MAFTQGAPLPNITETTTKSSQAPEYYTNYLSGLSQAGQTAMNRTPQQSVAGYDPLQTMGYSNLPAATTSYQPQLQAAQNTAAQAAQGITPERIQSLMNPYTSNVVDEMARLSQQNVQRNVLPSMKAGFVGTGGLGSQRYAGALGQSMADIQAGLTGQQYGALSKGYSEALKGALDEAQLQNLTAGTQGKLAAQELESGLAGVGALTKAGAERQAYEQSLLDAPLRTATSASGLMRGFTVPETQTQTFVGPKAGAYQLSDYQNILGILSLIGSGYGGATGQNAAGAAGAGLNSITGALTGAGSDAYNWLKNKFSSSDSTDTFGASPQETAVNAAVNQGYTLNPETGYLVKDGNNFAFDANNNLVAVGE
jgi:hypothetical protein